MAWKRNIDFELITAICSGNCVLFIGAGLSIDAKLPNWRQLLIDMLAHAGQIRSFPNYQEIKDLIDEGKYLVAAQELEDILGKTETSNFIKSIFKPTNAGASSPVHLVLPEINIRAILTTNYDTLVEEAYMQKGYNPLILQNSNLKQQPSPLRRHNDFFIFKMHGQFDSEVVLGLQSYQSVMFDIPGYRQFLESIFSVYTVLFIGFGGKDPHLENILDRLSGIYSRQFDVHFIVLKKDEMPNETERRRLEKDRRLRVIIYDHYSEVKDFLTALQKTELNCNIPDPFQKAKQVNKMKVFISHRWKDHLLAEKVINTLEEAGYSTWRASKYDFEGEHFSITLSKALSSADCILVIFTPTWEESVGLKEEANYAIFWSGKRNIAYFPVATNNVENLPFYMKNEYFISIDQNFTSESRRILLRTLEQISQRLSGINESDVNSLTMRVVNLMKKFNHQSISGELLNSGYEDIILPHFRNVSYEILIRETSRQERKLRRINILTENPRWVVEIWDKWPVGDRDVSPYFEENLARYLRDLLVDTDSESIWVVVGGYIPRIKLLSIMSHFRKHQLYISTLEDIVELEKSIEIK